VTPELQVPPADRENSQNAATHKTSVDHEMVSEMFTVYMVLMRVVAKSLTAFLSPARFCIWQRTTTDDGDQLMNCGGISGTGDCGNRMQISRFRYALTG
jgi:hypothetical protein